jgi:hypothetical protein
LFFVILEKGKYNIMDRGIGSSLLTKKLDRSNYTSWSYKMHQYLLGHDYWSYVEGANDTIPESTHKNFSAWEQAASRVLYCLASYVNDQLLSHIGDAKTSKDAWVNLKRIFAASTMTGSHIGDAKMPKDASTNLKRIFAASTMTGS